MVYLVDDDPDDLELVQEAFQRRGFQGQIASAANGADFLSKLNRSNLPELIILDLNMPLKDGFEVLTELKKSRNFSAVPVIILTASHSKHDEKKCLELGCNLFLRKPSTLEGYDEVGMIILDFLRDLKENKHPFIGKQEG